MSTSSQSTTIQLGSYTLHRSPASLYPFEVYLNVFKVVHCGSWFLWLLHMISNLLLVYQAQQDLPHVPWKIWIALLCDFLLTIPDLVIASTIILALSTHQAAQARPDYKLQAPVAPTVDVLITSCGEPCEIVINTIAAAAAQDYPPERLRVVVLDDGHDADLRYAVDRLRLRLEKRCGPAVIYLSRTVRPGQESYFKSGNLQFGIEQSQRFVGKSEYLAGLDADMIPEPDWLKRLIPHLLVDDRVAMAVGPQVRHAKYEISCPSTNPLPYSSAISKSQLYVFL